MYNLFLNIHSYLRYFILIFLVIVIVKSLAGWLGKSPYTKLDNKISLYLLIFTHLQVVAGLVLYFISPLVKFGGGVMAEKIFRYWTVEHAFGMIIAIALITVARTTSKRMASDTNKHKRLAIFNLIALLIIVAMIMMSPDRTVI